MKSHPAVPRWLLALLPLVVQCGGSPSVTCQMQNCTSGTKSYQVCSHVDESLSYNYGGGSCGCSAAGQAMCQMCATQVAAYCAGTSTGGVGGNGGSGGSGGGPAACMATFVGPITGTFAGCAAMITVDPANNVWTLSISGGQIANAEAQWAGVAMSFAGVPQTGTFDQRTSHGASNQVQGTQGSAPPIWVAGQAQGELFGTAVLTIDSLGDAMNLGPASIYQQPHGHITATLAQQDPATPMPDVNATITF
jgi:hypothetical protein